MIINKTAVVSMLLLMAAFSLQAQQNKKVLFVGNSYTSVNNLPKMVAEVALSMGDTVDASASTPGGCTFSQHCTNNSMVMIRQGGWDAVVLQEQSQYPSFPDSQVEEEVFPYAKRLVDSIYANSPCAEPIFYMTWGHKFGDQYNAQFFPPLGTYKGMDSLLALRYTQMAEDNDASLCPVGRVWHYLRDNYSDIELYQADNSHPTTAGSYAAACAFYTILFQKDPTNITFASMLDASVASTIRSVVKTIVFDSLTSLRRPMPEVSVEWPDTVQKMSEEFVVVASQADTVMVDWGDGSDTSFLPGESNIVSHRYADTGSYVVSLSALRHCLGTDTSWTFTAVSDSTGSVDPVNPEGISEIVTGTITLSPNPASGQVQIIFHRYVEWLEVCDMQGRVLGSHRLQADSCLLDISHLPEGSYLLRSIGDGAVSVARLVVVR